MKDVEPKTRKEADAQREQAERRALSPYDGRKRRKVGRTEPLATRTYPHIKKALYDMAEAEGRSYVEILEDAIERRHAAMKGERKP
jgi:hypothetical protein